MSPYCMCAFCLDGLLSVCALLSLAARAICRRMLFVQRVAPAACKNLLLVHYLSARTAHLHLKIVQHLAARTYHMQLPLVQRLAARAVHLPVVVSTFPGSNTYSFESSCSALL